ncbi:uncharacterized protein LOC131243856 [Magnolia sinica]|uniref:uncharacterized protein LOC131243856 n=1 Tax=Magnolia sinica TaxID=86752 RepID=UPI00265A142A|nr:uncharacterized protein LOC131243856 [Magnolia sinica]XP_058099458.1 uncharacterized protein LOC131243856 [Magnolia sinica]
MEDVQPASSSMEDVQPASSSSPLSSSTIASDLFGGKESSASANTSSPGIFSSLFPRPASTMVMGRDSSHFDSFGLWKRQNPELQVSNTKHVPADRIDQGGGNENKSIPNKDKISAYPDETVEPCFLSSSLYYGGRDVYSHSNTQASGTPAIFKKVDGEDPNASNGNDASRGNWWQGSLYY